MAVGDVKSDLQSVTNGSSMVIQPPSGEEWVIHNLYWGNAVSIKVTKGALTITVDSDTSTGGRLGTVFHVTNTQYLTITNNHTASIGIGYDGVQTK
jgi:hypothetical protein